MERGGEGHRPLSRSLPAPSGTLFISLSLVPSIGNGSVTASVHTRCGSLFRLITPSQACPTPRDRRALISTNCGVPLYGGDWELGFRGAVRRPGGLGMAIGPGHRPCPAPRATRCLTLAHHFPSGARASCPPPAQGRMNEPPAGRNARNYRPDQRPHAARPGRQRDRVPLKGGRNGGRPGATTGPPGPPFPVRQAGPARPPPPPGPQLPPGVATASGHDRPGKLGRTRSPEPPARRALPPRARSREQRTRTPQARSPQPLPVPPPRPASPAARPLTPPQLRARALARPVALASRLPARPPGRSPAP